MESTQLFSLACIVLLALTALVHSVFGEKLLLRPLFAKGGNPVLAHPLARLLLRFTWHLTSLLWLLLAAVLYWAAFSPSDLPANTLLATGLIFLAVGLFDLVASKARHIGWPLLTLIGVCALAGWASL